MTGNGCRVCIYIINVILLHGIRRSGIWLYYVSGCWWLWWWYGIMCGARAKCPARDVRDDSIQADTARTEHARDYHARDANTPTRTKTRARAHTHTRTRSLSALTQTRAYKR